MILFFSRTSSIAIPLRYPDLDTSMYIAHKQLPKDIEPQSAVPQTFLDFADNKKTKDTEAFKKSLIPIQEGAGVDKQTAAALAKPVKVSFPFIIYWVLYKYANKFTDHQL